ncbi:MAG: hypothetical protein NVV62_18480 [Terricaulis sp.]|nr:hypothetical protein [Terricaulis sp.]
MRSAAGMARSGGAMCTAASLAPHASTSSANVTPSAAAVITAPSMLRPRWAKNSGDKPNSAILPSNSGFKRAANTFGASAPAKYAPSNSCSPSASDAHAPANR